MTVDFRLVPYTRLSFWVFGCRSHAVFGLDSATAWLVLSSEMQPCCSRYPCTFVKISLLVMVKSCLVHSSSQVYSIVHSASAFRPILPRPTPRSRLSTDFPDPVYPQTFQIPSITDLPDPVYPQ